jgi:hypothetical protein
MGKFMLKLIGMYIPFVMVILGIGACSFVYKDELFGRFNSSQEVTEDVGQLPTDAEPMVDEVTPEEPTEPESEIVDEGTESSTDSGLPSIGECFCPNK